MVHFSDDYGPDECSDMILGYWKPHGEFCDKRKVSYPKEVQEYFGDDLVDESESYIRSEMQEIDLLGFGGDGISDWATSIPYEICDEEMTACLEIKISDIPSGLKALKMKLSW